MKDHNYKIGRTLTRIPGQWQKFLADFNAELDAFPVINVVGTNGKGSVGWQLMMHLQILYPRVG